MPIGIFPYCIIIIRHRLQTQSSIFNFQSSIIHYPLWIMHCELYISIFFLYEKSLDLKNHRGRRLKIENWRWSSLNAKHIRLQRSLRSVTTVSVGPADSSLWKGKHSEGVPPPKKRAMGDSFRVVLSVLYLSVGTAHPRLSSGDAFSVFLNALHLIKK